jgi:peptidoglycan L-alanyl-D-glutamate endopeptidase CwlK
MVDKISVDRIKLLHPKLRDEANNILELADKSLGKAELRFTHTLRTFQEQDMLYSIGRTTKGKIVTSARGGFSYHNYGLAIDICLLVDGKANWDVTADYDRDGKSDWTEVVSIFKHHGWEWGGDWRFYDPPHFQKTFGKSIAELRSLKLNGKVDKEGFVLF